VGSNSHPSKSHWATRWPSQAGNATAIKIKTNKPAVKGRQPPKAKASSRELEPLGKSAPPQREANSAFGEVETPTVNSSGL